MRRLGMLALVLASGCYASHGRERPDDGGAPRDATVQVDAPRCADGAACDDGDPCTRGDRCEAGRCVGAPMVCDPPPGACAVGACVDGRCEYRQAADGAVCDDQDACTSDDRCSGGACAGAPAVCDSPPAPTCAGERIRRTFAPVGVCEAGECRYSPVDSACPAACVDGACACAPQGWAFADVDEGPLHVGGPAPYGIALDAEGGVHVVHRAEVPGVAADQISYSYRPPRGEWETERIGRGGGIPAIAVGPSGEVHVLYPHPVRVGSMYARRPAGGGPWEITELEGPGGSMQAVVDPSGMLFARGIGTRSPSGVWTFEPPPGNSRLVLDASGAVHAISRRTSWTITHHVHPLGGDWRSSTLPSTEPDRSLHALVGSNFAIDAAGGMHFVAIGAATFPSTDTIVRHVYLPAGGGAWELDEHSIAGGREAAASAVAVSPDGAVHVAYVPQLPDVNRLMYVRRSPSGAWSSELMATRNTLFPVNWVTLAADPTGGVHLAFDDYPVPLRYGYRRYCD